MFINIAPSMAYSSDMEISYYAPIYDRLQLHSVTLNSPVKNTGERSAILSTGRRETDVIPTT